jgi:FtsH-binding integral membrane protein
MSHTVVMLLAGLALLIVFRVTIRDAARATRIFLILWLVVSVGNLLVGVLYADYGWAEEAGIWLLVFGGPAVVALVARRIVP